MINPNLPTKVSGSWIWHSAAADQPERVLLLRREFSCTVSGQECLLWISASATYKVFINGRFIAFGPRWHQDFELENEVDFFDVTYDLETGTNVIAIIASDCRESSGSAPLRHGVWCQLEGPRGPWLATDDQWQIREGDAFYGCRARLAADQRHGDFCRAGLLPQNWLMPNCRLDDKWNAPDQLTAAARELFTGSPQPPAAVSQEIQNFAPVEKGTVTGLPNWTQIVFPEAGSPGSRTYAASAWIFAQKDLLLPCSIISDDPFRFFSGSTLAASGKSISADQPCLMALKRGWNRMLAVQTPRASGMGLLLLLPDKHPDVPELRIFKDPVSDAPAAWTTVGPLKLPLTATTPSLNFERLSPGEFRPLLESVTDPATLLNAATLTADEAPDQVNGSELGQQEYRLYQLDVMRYGFAEVTLTASEGDVIDVTIGTCRTVKGCVASGEKRKRTGTLICREGVNHYLSRLPGDAYFLLITVRRARRTVRIGDVSFRELLRPERQARSFRCADAELNRFWQTGRQTLRRTAALTPQPSCGDANDVYLIDAYLDAVNMAANSGDFEYNAAQLEKILRGQLENGDVPVLTTRTDSVSQLHHLFFLPLWINHNYRLTGNLVELERCLPALDRLHEYLLSLLDEHGLLTDFVSRYHLSSPLSMGKFPAGAIPTYLNALYCRFLLSSAELYRAAGRLEQAKRSLLQAQRTADLLRSNNFDPEKGLFRRWQNDLSPQGDVNLFSNFCALFGGVLDLESFEAFYREFFNYDPPFDRSEEAGSGYFHFFFLEMLFALGQRAWAFRYFRDYWSRRLSEVPGAWKSSADDPVPAPTRLSGGGCISPNVFLIREVLGVRIAEAGHTTIYFHPAYRLTDWAEGEIPVPHGRLSVRWAKQPDGSLEVTLDTTIPLKVLPELSDEMLANTTFRLGEQVTLLDPPEDWVDNDGYLD